MMEETNEFEVLDNNNLNDVDVNDIDINGLMSSLGFDFEELEKGLEDYQPKMPLQYSNNSDVDEPSYAYPTDSGFDLRSTENIILYSGERALIGTGLSFDIPDGYELQVRSKSGLALKEGIIVLNSPGTVDCGYTSEVKVILFNTGKNNVRIKVGQKIAQAVICPVVNGKWIDLVKVNEIGKKDRNHNGFGSTGE